MCGFVGIVRWDEGLHADDRLEAALEYLRPRGPDAAGQWREPGVLIGHRRLAVIDLNSVSDQPMVSADGRFVIVYNGEIYNFRQLRAHSDLSHVRWRTEGDTEVILAAYAVWGKDCVLHFEGMFAFAIWDRQRREIFAARDRLGVKPFYYSSTGGLLAFGSRPRAVRMAAGIDRASIDADGVCAYLDLGFLPAPLTALQSIRKLPPASRVVWRGREETMDQYWSPFARQSTASLGPDTDPSIDELEREILAAVESRLVSDVPIGAFLSGGIDSSLVVAAMARLRDRDVDTFTIGFSGGDDESERARAIAQRLQVRNRCEVFSPDDLLGLLPLFLKAFDEPFFDSSAFPVMAVSRLARQSVTVALSGDGGDELFGGYPYYQWMRWFRTVDLAGAVPRRLLGSALSLSSTPRAAMIRGALACPDVVARYMFMRGLRKDLPDVVAEEVRRNASDGLSWYRSAARRVQREPEDPGFWADMDKVLILPGDYLQKVDVASMAFSLEVREPLLATSLVALANRVPGHSKVGWRHGKQRLRALAAKWVGGDLYDKRKRGFSVPIARWLRGGLREWGAELSNDADTLRSLGLRPDRVRTLWDLHQSGKRDVHSFLWAILMLVAWYREECLVGDGI